MGIILPKARFKFQEDLNITINKRFGIICYYFVQRGHVEAILNNIHFLSRQIWLKINQIRLQNPNGNSDDCVLTYIFLVSRLNRNIFFIRVVDSIDWAVSLDSKTLRYMTNECVYKFIGFKFKMIT
jgi:hypothetical protein